MINMDRIIYYSDTVRDSLLFSHILDVGDSEVQFYKDILEGIDYVSIYTDSSSGHDLHYYLEFFQGIDKSQYEYATSILIMAGLRIRDSILVEEDNKEEFEKFINQNREEVL